jgi:hypothetical protein
MTEYPKRSTPGHDCPPKTDNPAPQPPAPGGTCQPISPTTPPTLTPPSACPEPESNCNCPKQPGTTANCLEDLIAAQSAAITAAESGKAFKAELEVLLGKAKAANQEYTRDKYDALVKLWVQRDAEIADLIRKLVCAVPCWRCIIDCHVCPLINELHIAEQWLYGDGSLPTAVQNLYDLQYWRARDKDVKERRFGRIKGVLAAWEKPATTIEKALADIKTMLEAAGKALLSDPGKVVYDVFFKIVPLHLAIAPPASAGWTTNIAKEYTELCGCDTGTADDCCGPDVGETSIRQRLTGPQAYLVDPSDYFGIICCLVQMRYEPAKTELGKATADLADVDDRIKRFKTKVENALKPGAFEKDAKGGIPSTIDCCDYEKDQPDQSSSQSR